MSEIKCVACREIEELKLRLSGKTFFCQSCEDKAIDAKEEE